MMWVLTIAFGAFANIGRFFTTNESLTIFFAALFFLFLLITIIMTAKAS